MMNLETCSKDNAAWKERFTLKLTVTPVINPPRRVPFVLKEKLKSELDRLEGLEMIRKVKEPTDWVLSLVVVEKPNGKLTQST